MPPRETFLTAYKMEESIASVESHSKRAANRLLEELYYMGPIKSHSSLEKLKSYISEYIKFLPGLITPQKYCNLDYDPEIDCMLHGKILEEVIEKFDRNWPLQGSTLDPILKQLIIVDGATPSILAESLTSLTHVLKETNDEWTIFTISKLLELLVKSDSLSSAIINTCKCRIENVRQEEELDQIWQNVVQILISLPNRVANKLKDKTFDTFLPQIYLKIISFHIASAISFINTGLHHGGIDRTKDKTTLIFNQ